MAPLPFAMAAAAASRKLDMLRDEGLCKLWALGDRDGGRRFEVDNADASSCLTEHGALNGERPMVVGVSTRGAAEGAHTAFMVG